MIKKKIKETKEISGEHNAGELSLNNNRKLVIIASGFDAISFRFLSEFVCIGRAIFKKRMSLILPHPPSADIFFPGEKIRIYSIRDFDEKEKSRMNPLFILFNLILIELKISYLLLKGNKTDIYVFFLCQSRILSLFILKLQHKKSILMLGASLSALSRVNPGFVSRIFSVIEKIDFKLADTIVVYSPKLISDWHLGPYRNKILVAHEHFLDFTTFTVVIPFADRAPVIGYIGRLSVEKGVQHFVSSLPFVLDSRKDLQVFIGGDGNLKETIVTMIETAHLNTRIDLGGWIPHEDLPGYLNRLRLLVIPSYTEGLPNIMLEAMACGTPVLSTPVGAIPDFITDGKTGFIMENNSPACIAENITRALADPNLENIALNARNMVEKEFSFDSTVSQWKRIVDKI